jgi:DNA-binding transcriptional regulator LsrR (DeoR family)
MSPDLRIAFAAYYKYHQISNADIAKVLRVDVSSVSRYITQAKEKDWLEERLILNLPKEEAQKIAKMIRCPKLEAQLYALFSSSQENEKKHRGCLYEQGIVVVGAIEDVETHLSKQDINQIYLSRIGVEGAKLLLDVLSRRVAQRQVTLGVAWGRTTNAVVNALKNLSVAEFPKLLAIPLQGGIGMAFDQSENVSCYADVLAKEISDIFATSSPSIRISVPAYIDYQTADEVGDDGLEGILKFIKRDKSFRRAEEAYNNLDIGIVGIGALEAEAWAFKTEYLVSKEEISALQKAGVCGDIVCRFYRDVVEDPVDTRADLDTATTTEERTIRNTLYKTNRRAIGISLRQIRQRISSGARIIGVAGGKDGVKARAIYGALINGYITDLVTDEITAEKIIECATISK